MREVQGYPLPLGVQISKDRVNFSIAVPADKDCQLLLYRTGRKKPCRQFDMKPMIGEVRCIALEDIQPGDYEYNYLINKEVVTDPYVKAIAGKERWPARLRHDGALYDRHLLRPDPARGHRHCAEQHCSGQHGHLDGMARGLVHRHRPVAGVLLHRHPQGPCRVSGQSGSRGQSCRGTCRGRVRRRCRNGDPVTLLQLVNCVHLTHKQNEAIEIVHKTDPLLLAILATKSTKCP